MNYQDHRGIVHAPGKNNHIALWQSTRCVASIQATWAKTSAPVTCQWCLAMIAKWGA